MEDTNTSTSTSTSTSTNAPANHGPAPTTWQLDMAHSSIQFTARHMVIARVRGSFERWTLDLALDEADLTRSQVAVVIEAASLDTRNAQRDEHLRSADFFDVQKFPRLTFRSRRIERAGDGYRVIGDLTIRDVTREVALDVEQAGFGQDPWGQTRAMFSARTSIDRRDFGLTWNAVLETGGVLVGERIEIAVDLQVVKQAQAAGAEVVA